MKEEIKKLEKRVRELGNKVEIKEGEGGKARRKWRSR